jgi:glutathione S-transferase
MWILRSSGASPFGRKVRIAAAVCGVSERLRIETADTNDPADSLRTQNPLGKIPALLLEDGAILYDSRVILEFFDFSAGGGVILPAGAARFPALALQALADGIMDAGILQVYETRFRPEETHSRRWLEHQAGKVERALAALERDVPAETPLVGQIALASALGYLDFRFAGRWRGAHPGLAEWLARFAAAIPAFEATRPA